ncbi:MAG: hypothetical protein WCO45_07860 [Pseudanabaena sp. ELA607]
MLKINSYQLSILLILVGLLFPNLAIANQKQAIVNVPPDSRLSCDEAIANVKEDLTQRGFFKPYRSYVGGIKQPEARVYRDRIQVIYFDYPPNRTETVIFDTIGAKDLFRSPKLMATLSSQVMAECDRVGIVGFSNLESTIDIGYFPDNTARTFINLYDPKISPRDRDETRFRKTQTPQGERSLIQWGFNYSPLGYYQEKE